MKKLLFAFLILILISGCAKKNDVFLEYLDSDYKVVPKLKKECINESKEYFKYINKTFHLVCINDILLEEDNKYKSNVVFVTKDIVEKVKNCLQNFEGTFIDKAISFANENLEYYKSIVENKDIPDNLLMWSLLMNILSYTNTFYFLEDYEFAKLGFGTVKIFNKTAYLRLRLLP